MLRKEAIKELREYNDFIQNVDPTNIFTIRLLKECQAGNLDRVENNIRQCNPIRGEYSERNLPRHLHLLQYEDGGSELERAIISLDTEANVHQFFSSIGKILWGLQQMMEREFVHLDLKKENILYNGVDTKMIDYGFVRRFSRILECLDQTTDMPNLTVKYDYIFNTIGIPMDMPYYIWPIEFMALPYKSNDWIRFSRFSVADIVGRFFPEGNMYSQRKLDKFRLIYDGLDFNNVIQEMKDDLLQNLFPDIDFSSASEISAEQLLFARRRILQKVDVFSVGMTFSHIILEKRGQLPDKYIDLYEAVFKRAASHKWSERPSGGQLLEAHTEFMRTLEAEGPARASRAGEAAGAAGAGAGEAALVAPTVAPTVVPTVVPTVAPTVVPTIRAARAIELANARSFFSPRPPIPRGINPIRPVVKNPSNFF